MDIFDVVIIGGGWSGLLMLKHALAEGLRAVVLEAREAVGGVWRFTDDSGGGESASDLIEEMMRGGRVTRVIWSIPNGQHFFRKYGYWLRKNPLTGRPLRPEAFDKQSSLLQGLMSPAYKGKDGMRWGCKWTTSGSLLAYQGHGVPEWRSNAQNMHAFVNKSANVRVRRLLERRPEPS